MDSLDTPTQLTFERSFYIGGYFTAILYGELLECRFWFAPEELIASPGIQLCMFLVSNYFVIYSPGTSRKESKFYVLYGSVLLFLWTIALSCNAVFGEFMWIDHRDFPGGPAAYLGENISAWYNTVGTVAGVSLNFMGDALLVGRQGSTASFLF